MRFSETWLREFVNPPLATVELVDQLTMAGLEVDAVEPAAADFSGVVVAEVLSVQQHPDADRLRVCQVAVGEANALQIVCGAPNVRTGLKVPAALIGAVLPGNFKIKKSKLRGVQSNGMLCSEKELGLAGDAEGLLELPDGAPVGVDIRSYYALDDNLIELDLTPNRADCLSLEGIAREVAVLNEMDWSAAEFNTVDVVHQETLPVSVHAAQDCPRYLGRLIKAVNPKAETPLWMKERLRRSGLRSLGPLVDVTNYVLLELGQPLHAFDAAKLSGGIQVRQAHAGEQLLLLNDQTITLDDDVLVIADEQQALAFAGVMGGGASAVSDETRDIFLECAFFAPETLMGKARRFGLHTDSSHRFERGVDPCIQARAIERATQLLVEIAGGEAGPVSETIAENALPERTAVPLRQQRIQKILGVAMAAGEVEKILVRLGLKVEKATGGWQVTAPGFRFDIAIEEDLIEELGRIYGYNQLPKTSLLMRSKLAQAPEAVVELDRLKDLLVDLGYQEAISYSFVDQELQQTLAPDDKFIALQNPLSSEMAVMRTTLWCGLIQAALYNMNRQQHRIRLFESGLRFIYRDGELKQEKMLAGLALGKVNAEQWGVSERKLDFFDIKADLEALFALTAKTVQFTTAQHAALHPGQSAQLVTAEGEQIGWLGMLHPSLEKQLGFTAQVFLFELDQQCLQQSHVPVFQPLSRFPLVRRDLAIIVKEAVTADDIVQCIADCQEQRIQKTLIFDVYRGQGVDEGFKSIALGIIIQDSTQTLTDSEIDAILSKVLETLTNKIKAKLRD